MKHKLHELLVFCDMDNTLLTAKAGIPECNRTVMQLFRRMGGIPVERSRHTSMTDQLANWAMRSDRFSLAVTPEGTRSRVTQWKRGFYYIALKAKLPILRELLERGAD